MRFDLRVQLNDYRQRGVKAYLTGHVPPGKMFYYPSCWKRYTLWSWAFRDVILGHLYGLCPEISIYNFDSIKLVD
jgi:endopolyphosphatase